MPPSSPAVNSTCHCQNLKILNDDRSLTKTVQSYVETLVRPLGPCQIVILPSCQQKVNVDSPITHLTGTSKIDSTKLDALQQHLSQCCNSRQSCSIVISVVELMHLIPLDKPHPLSSKIHMLSSLEQRKKCLQHGMSLYFNNPQKIHEHNEPQNDEHHELQNDELQNDEHNEPQNDSGFGSGGWQRNVILDSRNDLDKLKNNCEELSQCCFYYGCIDSHTSSNLLRETPTGTFLIRDSSDPRYLYSLSVKTEKGATSIRVLYNNGFFQLDSDQRIRHKLPQFDTVLALVDFHVKATEEGSNRLWRWEDMSGHKSLRVVLKTPLNKSIPSLGHLSRVKVNQCINNIECPQLSIDRLPLDLDLKKLMRKYPYQI